MKIDNLLIVTLALTVILAVGGCTQETPSPGSGKSSAAGSPTAEQPAPQAAPEPPPPKTWPFIRDEDGGGELAEDLTAKNYFLVFDGSGSMQDAKCSGDRPKIDVAKEAVAQWSKTIPSEANLGLFGFHSQGRALLPLAAGDRDRFIQTIQGIKAGGNTPLTDATHHAYEEMTKQGQRQLGYGEYTMVVVTDGIANNVDTLSRNVSAILRTTPITVYSIGFCIGERHSLNQPGQTIYKAANNPTELRRGLEEVLAESEQFDDAQFNE